MSKSIVVAIKSVSGKDFHAYLLHDINIDTDLFTSYNLDGRIFIETTDSRINSNWFKSLGEYDVLLIADENTQDIAKEIESEVNGVTVFISSTIFGFRAVEIPYRFSNKEIEDKLLAYKEIEKELKKVKHKNDALAKSINNSTNWYGQTEQGVQMEISKEVLTTIFNKSSFPVHSSLDRIEGVNDQIVIRSDERDSEGYKTLAHIVDLYEGFVEFDNVVVANDKLNNSKIFTQKKIIPFNFLKLVINRELITSIDITAIYIAPNFIPMKTMSIKSWDDVVAVLSASPIYKSYLDYYVLGLIVTLDSFISLDTGRFISYHTTEEKHLLYSKKRNTATSTMKKEEEEEEEEDEHEDIGSYGFGSNYY